MSLCTAGSRVFDADARCVYRWSVLSAIAAGVEPAQGSFKATLSAYLPLITNMFLL